MVDIGNYKEEKSCVYNGEEYLVRDNGAVLRKSRSGKKKRKFDDTWTFGKANAKTGYLEISSERVHRIVATAFLGEPPTKQHVVDHIDTNRHNNRPSNLRWLTRLENVILNETTRKKIEYRTGVDIFEFLKNPKAYSDCFEETDFSWMRTVTFEEARNVLENMKKWTADSNTQEHTTKKLGEWIYSGINNDFEEIQISITNSITPLAKQRHWTTPTEFMCCPNEINNNPIEDYLCNLYKDAEFSKNTFGVSNIEKFISVNSDYILVITTIPLSFKPFALTKITFENDFYVHESLGTFFTIEGAEKQFTLQQGLEWTGEDSVDDYL